MVNVSSKGRLYKWPSEGSIVVYRFSRTANSGAKTLGSTPSEFRARVWDCVHALHELSN